jgi:hypothetical protein
MGRGTNGGMSGRGRYRWLGSLRKGGRGLDTDGRMAVRSRSSSAQTFSFLAMERVTINDGDELNY